MTGSDRTLESVGSDDGDLVPGQVQLLQLSHGDEDGVFDEGDVVVLQAECLEPIQPGKNASFQAGQSVLGQLQLGQFEQTLKSVGPDMADLL